MAPSEVSSIFSSSATVYSPSEIAPFDEVAELGPDEPYGMSKYFIEQILSDVALGDDGWSIGLLRYFNRLSSPNRINWRNANWDSK